MSRTPLKALNRGIYLLRENWQEKNNPKYLRLFIISLVKLLHQLIYPNEGHLRHIALFVWLVL